MILDGNLLLDSASAITSSAASANTIDLAQQRDMGIGEPLRVLCVVDVTLSTTNSATLQVLFQGSTDNVTWDTYVESPVYAAAGLNAGSRLLDIDVPRPADGDNIPRYVRMDYVVGTGVFSAGSITSAIVLARDDQIVGATGYLSGYRSGFTVNN